MAEVQSKGKQHVYTQALRPSLKHLSGIGSRQGLSEEEVEPVGSPGVRCKARLFATTGGAGKEQVPLASTVHKVPRFSLLLSTRLPSSKA